MSDIKSRPQKFWMIVASKDHVKSGIQQGIAQACHGKASPLRRMRPGDGVIYYSGKLKFGEPAICQQFTAIGTVKDGEVYAEPVTPYFCPSRRAIDFFPAADISILPLINALSFIRNKQSWGYPFRFGFFEIPADDFELIASKMLKDNDVPTRHLPV